MARTSSFSRYAILLFVCLLPVTSFGAAFQSTSTRSGLIIVGPSPAPPIAASRLQPPPQEMAPPEQDAPYPPATSEQAARNMEDPWEHVLFTSYDYIARERQPAPCFASD